MLQYELTKRPTLVSTWRTSGQVVPLHERLLWEPGCRFWCNVVGGRFGVARGWNSETMVVGSPKQTKLFTGELGIIWNSDTLNL